MQLLMIVNESNGWKDMLMYDRDKNMKKDYLQNCKQR